MNRLHGTHIDFLKYRRFWIAVSLLVMAGGVGGFFVHGKLNVGIEFAGGTQLTLRFRDPVEMERIRGLLAGAGVTAQIQQFGPSEERSLLIKVPAPAGEADDGSRVFAALDAGLGRQGALPDLNRAGSDTLREHFARIDPRGLGPAADAEAYADLAEAILANRRELGVLRSWDEVAALPQAGGEVAALLERGTTLGPYSILGIEAIGAQVGSELRMNLSLNQTLSRTLLTSGTTLLAAGSLLAFGGEQLRGFSFIMTAGVVVGTYSSIYIACPFALLWTEAFKRRAGKSMPLANEGKPLSEPQM